MASRNVFEIEGLKELNLAIAKMPDLIRRYVQTGVDKAGDVLLNATKQKVPVKFGKLKSSLHIKRDNSNATVSNTLTWRDDVRDYAAPLELGHRLVAWGNETNVPIKPRPFLRPAADENKEKVFDIITTQIDIALKEFGK